MTTGQMNSANEWLLSPGLKHIAEDGHLGGEAGGVQKACALGKCCFFRACISVGRNSGWTHHREPFPLAWNKEREGVECQEMSMTSASCFQEALQIHTFMCLLIATPHAHRHTHARAHTTQYNTGVNQLSLCSIQWYIIVYLCKKPQKLPRATWLNSSEQVVCVCACVCMFACLSACSCMCVCACWLVYIKPDSSPLCLRCGPAGLIWPWLKSSAGLINRKEETSPWQQTPGCATWNPQIHSDTHINVTHHIIESSRFLQVVLKRNGSLTVNLRDRLCGCSQKWTSTLYCSSLARNMIKSILH